MAKFYVLLFIFFLGIPPFLVAQDLTKDTVLQLPVATVKADRLTFDKLGRNVAVYDSSSLALLQSNSLSELLQTSGQLFIKDYGPGRLATPSVRGGSAAQTVVLWNGINIQSPMLGQVDLSLLPIQFVDEVSLDRRGGSAFWGTGAVSGIIQLKNKASFRPGIVIKGGSNLGSFQHQKHQFGLNYGRTNWNSQVSAFYHSAENDFTYLDLNKEARRLTNSMLTQYGVSQNHHFLINSEHALSLNIWWQEAEREIPPTRVESSSAAKQNDQSLRTILSWQFQKKKYQSEVKFAWLEEALDFVDPIARINSESKAQTAIGIWNLKWKLNANQLLEGDFNFTHTQVKSSEYGQNPNQDRLALSLAYYLKNPLGKWQFSMASRQEIVDGAFVPMNISTGFEWQVSRLLKSRAAFSRNYRLPTFNDLYWSPGGNRDLEAESGWSGELGLEFQEKWSLNNLKIKSTVFNSQVNNWIIWIPDGSIWTPKNIQQVWSRGWENQLEIQRKFTAGQVKLEAYYTYVRSTNQKTQSTNDAIKGKQLIYVPKHQTGFGVQLNLNHWTFHYQQNLTGSVFTLPDNSNTIPAYSTGVFRLQKNWQWKKSNWNGHLAIRNLWNQEYEVVLHRPMPGRHYEIGLQIILKN